jgi:hypothetical protein
VLHTTLSSLSASPGTRVDGTGFSGGGSGGSDGGTPPSSPITSESEPNDSASSADARVARDTPVTGAISSSTDVDWFSFTVDAAGSVTVSLTMAGGADLDWYLYSASNTSTYLTRGYTSSNPEQATYNVTQPGTYYVQVVGYSGSTDSYTLQVSGAGVSP